ncbi:MAG: AAA family ATPase [Bacillota bacterium]
MRLAVAGKGGSGKTTFAALAIVYLVKLGYKPVLAIDADPNANLGEALGLQAPVTVAGIVGEMAGQGVPAGMSKDEYVKFRVHQALAEGRDIDLLAMGAPEGPGCYCYANSVLRRCVASLGAAYRCVVLDNEAGLEHFSRRTTGQADALVVVSDPTVRGLLSAARIAGLVKTLGLGISRSFLVVNRAPAEACAALRQEIGRTGLEFLGTVPYDRTVAEYDMAGRPLAELPDAAPAATAVQAIVRTLLKHHAGQGGIDAW